MYWRIRKITPDIVFRQYGVHAVCIVSVIFNLFLFTRANAGHALGTAQKLDYDHFARQVTNHLFDASYVTIDDSMGALEKELSGPPRAALMKADILPKDKDDEKAISRQLAELKSVSCIKFNSVEINQPTKEGFLPVDIKFVVTIHDTEGVRTTPMKWRYYCGQAMNKQTNETYPIVVDIKQMDPGASSDDQPQGQQPPT